MRSESCTAQVVRVGGLSPSCNLFFRCLCFETETDATTTNNNHHQHSHTHPTPQRGSRFRDGLLHLTLQISVQRPKVPTRPSTSMAQPQETPFFATYEPRRLALKTANRPPVGSAHYGTVGSAHFSFLNASLAAKTQQPLASPVPSPRSGIPPPFDVSKQWKDDAAARSPCWPTHRDAFASKPTKPWASSTGFFYGERLSDQAVPPPSPAPPTPRPTLLHPSAPPTATTTLPLASSWGRGGESGQPPRWLTPRYLNGPSPASTLWAGTPDAKTREERFLNLPPPWGGNHHAPTADGISRRWPEMMAA